MHGGFAHTESRGSLSHRRACLYHILCQLDGSFFRLSFHRFPPPDIALCFMSMQQAAKKDVICDKKTGALTVSVRRFLSFRNDYLIFPCRNASIMVMVKLEQFSCTGISARLTHVAFASSSRSSVISGSPSKSAKKPASRLESTPHG